MKALLDELELRLTALLEEKEALREEIASLTQKSQAEAAPLREEISFLRAELEQEKAVREAATQRIDALLLRVKGR